MSTFGTSAANAVGETSWGAPDYILDGKNIGKWRGPKDGRPVVEFRILLTLVAELLRKHVNFICLFEANTSRLITDESAKLAYARLVANFPDIFLEMSDGSRPGQGVLMLANRYEKAQIVSNDDYSEFRSNVGFRTEYPWLLSSRDVKRCPRLMSGAAIPEMEALIVGGFDINIKWGKSADVLYAKIVSMLRSRLPIEPDRGWFAEQSTASQPNVFIRRPVPLSV